jgi:thiamine-phosphate pyrophosphorylase
VPLPVLQAIVDVETAKRAGWSPQDLAEAYIAGGARFLQVRAKTLPSGAFLALCDGIVSFARRHDTLVIINDRVDIARLSSAAGVHVGQDDVSPRAAREQLGVSAIIGLSTHTRAQVERAFEEPVSYIAVGPVFTTRTKDTGYNPVGLELLRHAVEAAPPDLPIVAIGGITLESASAALAAGASAIAVIGDLLAGRSPSDRVAAYHRALL